MQYGGIVQVCSHQDSQLENKIYDMLGSHSTVTKLTIIFFNLMFAIDRNCEAYRVQMSGENGSGDC